MERFYAVWKWDNKAKEREEKEGKNVYEKTPEK